MPFPNRSRYSWSKPAGSLLWTARACGEERRTGVPLPHNGKAGAARLLRTSTRGKHVNGRGIRECYRGPRDATLAKTVQGLGGCRSKRWVRWGALAHGVHSSLVR
jgi:hypothetical protein